jgi:altronate dehydratase
MINALRIHPEDTVVVALVDLAPGARVELADGPDLGIVTCETIPFGHKVAIAAIAQGQHVVKYGASIGLATQDIAPGQHVHVHNLTSVRGAAQR